MQSEPISNPPPPSPAALASQAPAVKAAAVPPTAAAAAAPAPPPPPNPLPQVDLPFEGVDFNARGVHAVASVTPDRVVEAAEKLAREGFAIDTITGVDWLAEGQMEVVYDYFHPQTGLRAVVRSRIPRETAEIPSIHQVFPGANWHERETHDFFGIKFLGHPDLSPFLLPEDSNFHPLRKDYAP